MVPTEASGGIDYINVSETILRSTIMLETPQSLAQQVPWVAPPTVIANGDIFFNDSVLWQLSYAQNRAEPVFPGPLAGRLTPIRGVLVHETLHQLGFLSRGSDPIDLNGNGMYDNCEDNPGPVGIDLCDDFITTMDVARFTSGALPLSNALNAQSARRVMQQLVDQVFTKSLTATALTTPNEAIQFAVALTVNPDGSGEPQPNHLRSRNAQSQFPSPQFSSLGVMGPTTSIEIGRLDGVNALLNDAIYSIRQNVSIRDLAPLDLIGWNIDPLADLSVVPTTPRVTVTAPSGAFGKPNTPQVIEPTLTIIGTFADPIQNDLFVTVYEGADALAVNEVLFDSVLLTGEYSIPSGTLQRGQTYAIYLHEQTNGGSTQSERRLVLIRCLADQNSDGMVTPSDYNGWILNFNMGDLRADTTEDGVLTPADFNRWIIAFNNGCS